MNLNITDNKIRIILFIGLLSLFSCNETKLVEEMVNFDQSFIPVWQHLYNVEIQKEQHNEEYLIANWIQFSKDWTILKEKYQYEKMNDDWQETFRFIGMWIDEADSAMFRNDFEAALVYMDHLRFEISELRYREGIDYALDKLWDYEIALSILLDATREPQLYHLGWDEVALIVSECNRTWLDVMAEAFDNQLFDIDENSEAHLQDQFTITTVKWNEVNLLVTEGYVESIIPIVDELMKSYLELLKEFGDPVQPNEYIAFKERIVNQI